MMTARSSGLFAEWYARQFLRLHGFRILASRYITGRFTGRAELDIIARRGDMAIFVEVKKRSTAELGVDAVSSAQAGRLRAAAENWIRRNRWTGPARFDLAVVSGLRIRWFKNAV
ncbi:MAG: YraN family protein [Rickettsiales bacterium]|jgi:putative endonuclease|nr:YraN family protein [Rickettsiales bacterium]